MLYIFPNKEKNFKNLLFHYMSQLAAIQLIIYGRVTLLLNCFHSCFLMLKVKEWQMIQNESYSAIS